MDPMCDLSENWCHYRGESGRVEAFNILKHILNDMRRLGGGGGVLIIYIHEILTI